MARCLKRRLHPVGPLSAFLVLLLATSTLHAEDPRTLASSTEPLLAPVPTTASPASSGTNPLELRTRGEIRRSSGIAVMVFGSLHLALGIVFGTIAIAIRCEGLGCLGNAIFGWAGIGNSIVAAPLLGIGIPVYLTGVRQTTRARRLVDEARRRGSLPPTWGEPVEEVLARGRARRSLGLRLLAGGAISFAVGAAGWGTFAGCSHFHTCPEGVGVAGLVVGPIGSALGSILLGVGGDYYLRGSRDIDSVSAKPRVELRLQLGTTVALTGRF